MTSIKTLQESSLMIQMARHTGAELSGRNTSNICFIINMNTLFPSTGLEFPHTSDDFPKYKSKPIQIMCIKQAQI